MRFIHYAGIGMLAAAVPLAGAAFPAPQPATGWEWEEADAGFYVIEIVPDCIDVAAPPSLTAPMALAVAPPPEPKRQAWVEVSEVAGFGPAAALQQLDDARGGSDTVSNEARLNGLVSGNSAINVSTGANTIDGAAFSNSSGIPIVIQNSGANVLIQNSTIVNLQVR